MKPQDVLQTPLRLFWLLSDTLDRVWAAKDMRQLAMMGADQSGEIYQQSHQRLVKEIGQVVQQKLVVEDDPAEALATYRAGISQLKMMNSVR